MIDFPTGHCCGFGSVSGCGGPLTWTWIETENGTCQRHKKRRMQLRRPCRNITDWYCAAELGQRNLLLHLQLIYLPNHTKQQLFNRKRHHTGREIEQRRFLSQQEEILSTGHCNIKHNKTETQTQQKTIRYAKQTNIYIFSHIYTHIFSHLQYIIYRYTLTGNI